MAPLFEKNEVSVPSVDTNEREILLENSLPDVAKVALHIDFHLPA